MIGTRTAANVARFVRSIVQWERLIKSRLSVVEWANALYQDSVDWWNPFANGSTSPNLIDLLDQKARGSVFVIMMHAFVERDVDLESRLKAWKAPAMARLEGTWLGLRSTERLMQTSAERGFRQFSAVDGEPVAEHGGVYRELHADVRYAAVLSHSDASSI
jgi:hypothetical protein